MQLMVLSYDDALCSWALAVAASYTGLPWQSSLLHGEGLFFFPPSPCFLRPHFSGTVNCNICVAVIFDYCPLLCIIFVMLWIVMNKNLQSSSICIWVWDIFQDLHLLICHFSMMVSFLAWNWAMCDCDLSVDSTQRDNSVAKGHQLDDITWNTK